MSKIKLLVDSQIFVSSKTGIFRTADALLHEFTENENVDLFIAKTSNKGNLIEYLQKTELYSVLKNKIISFSKLSKTTRAGNLYHKIRANIFKIVYAPIYKFKLKKFDAYFSVFHPISSIVYDFNIATFLMVHDLIPIVYMNDCYSNHFRKTFKNRLLSSRPDAYFCISEYTKSDFLKLKPNLEDTPVYITYLAAGNNFYPVNDMELIKNTMMKYNIKTKKYFLGVSEITKRKNFAHILDAFVEFLNKTKADDISLVIVGPKRSTYNEVTEKMNQLIKEYPGKIVLTGYVDDKDMASLYSGATAFIYPSLYEGFGLPILEAMKCGTPVICTDNTSLPEVAGDAALYISGNDVLQTVNALEKMYLDTELVKDLKQKGIKQASKFDWHKTADLIVNAMSDIVKKRKK